MIDLSSNAIASPAKISSASPAGNGDTQNNIAPGQGEDGLFHEELTREMNALQERSPAAKEGEDQSTAAAKGKVAEGSEDEPVAADGAEASMAVFLNGVLLLQAPAAAPLTVAPDASAATAAASLTETGAGAAAPRGLLLAMGEQEGRNARRPDAVFAIPADAESAEGRRIADFARGEQTLAAIAAAAESAATGKIRPDAREDADALASLESRAMPRGASEAPIQFSLNSATAANAHSAPQVVASIAAHIASPAWDRSLGEKVVWMAGQQLQVAQLNLNPPELGPLQVTLTISGNDQANAQFVSQHAAVREAIEAAMPRLREMLAEGGITLGNASVSADAFREQSQSGQDARGHAARGREHFDSGGELRMSAQLRQTRGLVDIFA